MKSDYWLWRNELMIHKMFTSPKASTQELKSQAQVSVAEFKREPLAKSLILKVFLLELLLALSFYAAAARDAKLIVFPWYIFMSFSPSTAPTQLCGRQILIRAGFLRLVLMAKRFVSCIYIKSAKMHVGRRAPRRVQLFATAHTLGQSHKAGSRLHGELLA